MTLHIPQAFKDAQAAAPFVEKQGYAIEATIYRKRYANLDYASHVPVVTEGNPWAIGTMFRMIDTTGTAKFISGKAEDLPKSSVTRDQASHDFAMIGAGWDWDIEEINQASMYGINLSDEKALGATRGIEQLLYDIAMIGAAEKGWTGLVNSAIVQRADAPATGTGDVTFWNKKTPLQILADLFTPFNTIKRNSKEIETANAIRLPPAAMDYIAQTYVDGDSTSPTILERFKSSYQAQYGSAPDIAPMRALETASQDGGGRLMVYRKEPDVVRFHLPKPRSVLPVWQNGLMSWEQAVIARTGGVEIRLPAAMAYLDEVMAPPA